MDACQCQQAEYLINLYIDRKGFYAEVYLLQIANHPRTHKKLSNAGQKLSCIFFARGEDLWKFKLMKKYSVNGSIYMVNTGFWLTLWCLFIYCFLWLVITLLLFISNAFALYLSVGSLCLVGSIKSTLERSIR